MLLAPPPVGWWWYEQTLCVGRPVECEGGFCRPPAIGFLSLGNFRSKTAQLEFWKILLGFEKAIWAMSCYDLVSHVISLAFGAILSPFWRHASHFLLFRLIQPHAKGEPIILKGPWPHLKGPLNFILRQHHAKHPHAKAERTSRIHALGFLCWLNPFQTNHIRSSHE